MDALQTPIYTGELLLSPVREEDEEAFVRMLQSQKIALTYMLPETVDRPTAQDLFRRYLKAARTPGRFALSIVRASEVVGVIHDTGIEEDRVEVGYFIGEEFWGRGYATAALQGLIDALFRAGCSSVLAAHFTENAASARVMEKCGMTLTGKTETVTYRGKERLCLYRERKRS